MSGPGARVDVAVVPAGSWQWSMAWGEHGGNMGNIEIRAAHPLLG